MGRGALLLPGSANRRLPAPGRERTCRRRADARPAQVAPLPTEPRGPVFEVPSTIESVVDVGDIAETGQLLQRLLRFVRQAGELPDHEVHDIVGIALGVNAIEIPGPARLLMIEGEQSLVGKRVEEIEARKTDCRRSSSCTSSDSGAASSSSQRSASAISRPMCSWSRGPSLISLTFAPELRMAVSFRVSGWAASTSLSR